MCQSSITSNAQIYKLNLYSDLSSTDQMLFGDVLFSGNSPRDTIISPKTLCWTMPYLYDGTGVWE